MYLPAMVCLNQMKNKDNNKNKQPHQTVSLNQKKKKKKKKKKINNLTRRRHLSCGSHGPPTPNTINTKHYNAKVKTLNNKPTKTLNNK